MRVKVFAKLNLSLNVFERQGQFHPIDSVVTSVSLCDCLSVTLRNDNRIYLCADDLPLRMQNTAYKAAALFRETFGGGCNIALEKHIPIGGGLGGSSADAAGVVYCLAKLRGISLECEQIHAMCAKLGSDVNFMLIGGLARMTGKGDDLQFGHLGGELHCVLTNFGKPLLTKDVYARFDEHIAPTAVCNNDLLWSLLQQGKIGQAIPLFCNGLQGAALTFADASELFDYCAQNGASCCMTGSGSAFFLPFATRDEAEHHSARLTSSLTVHTVEKGIEEF